MLADFFSILLEISCLDHILDAIDVEPVTGRIEYPDGILPFQQFLEQLGNAGFAVGWFGQHFYNDVGDEFYRVGRDFEEPHPDSVDGFFGEIVSQLLEIDLSIEGSSRIGNGALGKSAEAGIAALLLPIAVDENHAVIRLLTERLGNIFVEQHVAVGHDRALCRSFP